MVRHYSSCMPLASAWPTASRSWARSSCRFMSVGPPASARAGIIGVAEHHVPAKGRNNRGRNNRGRNNRPALDEGAACDRLVGRLAGWQMNPASSSLPAPYPREKYNEDPHPEPSNGHLIALHSDAALNAAWARRAGMISYVPPLGADGGGFTWPDDLVDRLAPDQQSDVAGAARVILLDTCIGQWDYRVFEPQFTIIPWKTPDN